MAFIPTPTIEAKALKLLEQYANNQQWDFSLPIPVEQIIETEVGYTIDCLDIGPPQVLGAISPTQQLIISNEKAEAHFARYPGTYQFTLAHEIGHWSLHLEGFEQPKLEGVTPYAFICRDDQKPQPEIQADMFAASLLMPTELIRSAINRQDPFDDAFQRGLAGQAKVSLTALRFRLANLKYIYYCKERQQFFRSEAHASGQQSLFA